MCAGSQGFRLLLASPDAGYKLFRGLQNNGHGQAKLFDGTVGLLIGILSVEDLKMHVSNDKTNIIHSV